MRMHTHARTPCGQRMRRRCASGKPTSEAARKSALAARSRRDPESLTAFEDHSVVVYRHVKAQAASAEQAALERPTEAEEATAAATEQQVVA